MSGKAYTMKEMKTIVEYLVEHRAYGEIKGRKMWIDFSNSQLTNRTWQSLKETFLKRILPDIHNPYYKLTMDQVCSFRQGFDVQSREKNKLEIQKLDGNSNSNAENLKTNEQPSTSKCIDEDKTSGEEIKSSRISARDRASVETVILDNCYETADDVLRDLESPNDSNDKEETAEGKSQSKSLRDLITYSEPLTPMLQEVLHDFATDDESDSGEPKMQIVENEQEPEEQGNVSSHRVPDAVEDILEHNKDQNDKRNKDESDKFVEPKVKSLRLRKRQGIYVPVDDLKASQNTNTTNSKNNKSDSNVTRMEIENGSGASMLSNSNEKGVDKLTKSHAQSTQNCSTSTTDTVLPNNQEALHDKKLENKKNRNEITVNKNNITRDRTASNDIEVDLKLQKANCNETTHNHISDANVDSQKTNCSDVIDISNEIDKNQNKKSDVVNNKQTPEDNTRDIFPPNKLPEKGDKNTSTQSSQANPCLQSMSLYDEQFNMTNHTSDSSEHETNNDQPRQTSNNNKPSSVTENKLASKLNEVVMLKSRSDTDSDSGKVPVKKDTKNIVLSKLKRDNALANIFGFSSGAVSSKRKKRTSLRKYSGCHNYHGNCSSYESSEWTSESDSDYVSPPRGHKNGRRAKKYLKPKSARIHSLEEEGGLFVMYGKKLFPLVKDGRTVNNYLIYSPDSDPDEEENYWKQKYVEERKRVEELKKFILRNKREEVRGPSPLLPTKPSRSRAATQETRSTSQIVLSSDNEKDVGTKDKIDKKEPLVYEPKNKTLKITFAKNNQEVHLEGHWSQLHPVLADVVEIFHKDTDVPVQSHTEKSGTKQPLEIAREKSPIIFTPADEDVRDKVDKLENEIFKEIEENDQEEQSETKDQTENNITKRKRANRLSSTSTEASNSSKKSASSGHSTKRAKIAKEIEEESNEKDTVDTDSKEQNVEIAVEIIEKGTEKPLIDKNESKTTVSPVKKRTPRKEVKPKESVKSISKKKSKVTTRRSNKVISVKENQSDGDDDSEVRYMFPPINRSTSKPSSSAEKTKRYSVNIPSIFSPPNSSQNSESTQGYQESDVSPPPLWFKKKRRLSLSTVLCKNKNKQIRIKRKSYPIIDDDVSTDSNNSYHIILKPTTNNCSIKSDEYRSESYQILMSHRRDHFFKPLEKIDEIRPVTYDDLAQINSTTSNFEIEKDNISINKNKQVSLSLSKGNIDVVNSSNVSLPLSPELSIVEKLSISKEVIDNLNNYSNNPTLNETCLNETSEKIVDGQYLISHVDVSMPLMQQECDVHNSLQGALKSFYSYDDKKNSLVSESLLNKINTVNIEENQSLSDSLHVKLKKLLLESAKKMSLTEDNDAANPKEIVKKPRSKRCSTPRKRKDTKKTKPVKVDLAIEEEFMEYCSYGGRNSCPPSVQDINDEKILNKTLEHVVNDKEAKTKERKKKDVIKVKITRPKTRSRKNENNQSEVLSASKASIYSSNETNDKESGISIQDLSGGNDLIHNHSETCLQANECIGDSIEFLELNAKSIISVDSSSTSSPGSNSQRKLNFHDCIDASEFNKDVRDYTTSNKESGTANTEPTSDTVYHSPNMSLTSLITEDLSDDNLRRSQSTKWYLLSEDETNTNIDHKTDLDMSNFSSNLKQLFPMICAVPDLSTITEASKDN